MTLSNVLHLKENNLKTFSEDNKKPHKENATCSDKGRNGKIGRPKIETVLYL